MFLNDTDIKKAVESKEIELSDFEEKRVQPASYDILLGNKFLITKSHQCGFIDPVNKILPEYEEVILKDDEHFVLHPWVSILGTSKDFFGSNKYLIQLSWKSSLARIGLIVHNTAWLINPGHYLNITLELCNLNSVPIILRPNMEIAQLLFSKMTDEVSRDYTQTWRYHEDNWAAYKDKE